MIEKTKIPAIGIDIEKVSRFKNAAAGKSAFLKRIYTSKELRYCLGKKAKDQCLAGKFAAKEAVKKAITGYGAQLDYKEIEIVNDKSGLPQVFLKGNLRERFSISLSISHTTDAAVASTVIFINI